VTSERHDEDLFTIGLLEEGGLAASAIQGDIDPASRDKANNAGKERITFFLRNGKYLIEIPFKYSGKRGRFYFCNHGCKIKFFFIFI
jgi:hypothetical protein